MPQGSRTTKENGGRKGSLSHHRYHRTPLRGLFQEAEEQPRILRLGGMLCVLLTTLLLASAAPSDAGPLALVGLFLFSTFVLAALALYMLRLQPRQWQTPKHLTLLATVVLATLLVVRGAAVLTGALATYFPGVPRTSFEYALPVAVGAVLLAVLFNARVAFAGSLAISLLSALMVGMSLNFFLFAMVGGLVGVFGIPRVQDRSTFFKAGCWVSLANAYSLVAFAFLEGNFLEVPVEVLAGLANGILTAVIASALLPALERLFETATDLRLLELSNMTNPLLRQLIMTAPGTYHHSIMVGTLSEAAAEAIGANSVLCRVGALYHDVGKIKKPAYFIENQPEALARHNELSPRMSSLIITSHVKEGIAMALEHRLPPAIVDLIPQHHGTRLVMYFFEKAKEAHDPDMGEVDEGDYRYPGPRPQTREAAVLMLADAVEAAARTLNDPTPARIQGVVQRIINTIFIEGQLDECDLTLKDLHLIAKAFIRILTGMYHHRVDYPGVQLQDFAKRRAVNGDPGPKPPAGEKGGDAPPAKRGPEDIKRLGLS
ncbi:MAG: HDIG domain-containing protein [candidate division NC10 bacterium]|nr:HDIG domain-containing protein [candidate division NC10 bacterium]